MKINTQTPKENLSAATPAVRAALRLLLEAHDLADKARRPAAEFALDFPCLLQRGAAASDLHGLLSGGYVACVDGSRPRGRLRRRAVVFTERTGFVLTESGVALARGWALNGNGDDAREAGAPYWDGRCELSFLGKKVKFFKGPAESQTTILAAFQSRNWIRIIDNPLPWQSQDDPQKALRNAVQRLNGFQITKLLAFHVTHCGTCVSWDSLGRRQIAGARR